MKLTLEAALAAIPWLEDLAEALRQKDSHSARASAMYSAVQAKYAKREGYAYPHAMFDKHVVVSHGDKLYQHKYSTSADGGITLGDPTEVESTYTPVCDPQESAVEIRDELVPLVESAIGKDGTTRIKVIAPGWGSSGYYSPELLERDGPQAFKAGTKMYLDHPTAIEEKLRPERSVKDLAATLTGDAKWDPKGPAGPGLYAEAKVMDTHKPFIESLAKHIGVSIRATGASKLGEAEGRKGPIIERIATGKSVDFVTTAGAGGQILTESGRSAGSLRELYEEAESATGDDMDLKEATAQLETQGKELKEARAQIARLLEANTLSASRTFVTRRLADPKHKNVPQLTKDRLLESLSGSPVVKDGAIDEAAFGAAIDEAVKAEVAYLASITGSGQVRGLGAAPEAKEVSEAEAEKELAGIMQSRFGLSESAAKIAAKGR